MFAQRVVDIQLAFPTILLAITGVAVLGSSVPILVFVFVLAGWVRYVRVIRAQTLVIREMPYIEAARATGARSSRILRRYVTPNLFTDILALVNLVAIMMLFPVAMRVLQDFKDQLRAGISRPVLDPEKFADLNLDRSAWGKKTW